MPFPPLYILRHGETLWNATGRLQGRYDSPLTSAGVAQARAQRRILGARDLTGCTAICSPQGRARRTAQIALAGLSVSLVPDTRLREIGLGDWAGRTRREVMDLSGAKTGFEVYALAPGGEGFERLHRRCLAFLRDLSGPTIVVTHGVTSRMLRIVLTGQSIAALPEIGGGQGVVYYVENGRQIKLAVPG